MHSIRVTPLEDEFNPVSAEQKARSLEELMIKGLQGTHETISEQLNQVEENLRKEELRRGQTIQQYLNLGRNIKLQEQHIGEGKARLERLRQRKDCAGMEIRALMAQIGGLVLADKQI